MTLTVKSDNQPKWVNSELGLEEFEKFKLGQRIKHGDDILYIIHMQKIDNEILCRCMLPNNASITLPLKQLKIF